MHRDIPQKCENEWLWGCESAISINYTKPYPDLMFWYIDFKQVYSDKKETEHNQIARTVNVIFILGDSPQ